MAYFLDDNLEKVKGVGPKLANNLAQKNINKIIDLLLFLPLRYEDRSKILTIAQAKLEQDNFFTLRAKVLKTNNFYRGRKSIQSATVSDETGKLKLMWFNNPWILKQLKADEEFIFSGKLSERGVLIQPVVEKIRTEQIHTGRLVPIYSALGQIKMGTLRKIFQEILDNLVINNFERNFYKLSLTETFKQLHFPETSNKVIEAREILATEELLTLIIKAQKIKQAWQHKTALVSINCQNNYLPKLPFTLTKAQQKASREILADLNKLNPMNRLLIGDVGSGKTVVAGIACKQILANNYSACLVAPTQILAKQHRETFKKLFPKLKTSLVIAGSKNIFKLNKKPTLYIGTHALINKLALIKPALIIYDEQHRFGVKQRNYMSSQENSRDPHILTMSATPIPRSLMLSIFSHLSLSVIDELPPGRKATQTWLTPPSKRQAGYNWLFEQLIKNKDSLALVVCPFIKNSKAESFSQIKAATSVYEELKSLAPKKLKIALLHGKLAKAQKEKVIKNIFSKKINLLITTPVIEVGLDVPNADIVAIESAQRFGLASLHQLRGRVGRAKQESFCLVLPSQKSDSQRLKQFCKENNGMKLAQLDLQRRGAGDLFGTAQSGLDNLRFTSWTNLELIKTARMIFEQNLKNTLKFASFLPEQKLKTEVAAN